MGPARQAGGTFCWVMLSAALGEGIGWALGCLFLMACSPGLRAALGFVPYVTMPLGLYVGGCLGVFVLGLVTALSNADFRRYREQAHGRVRSRGKRR